MIGGGIGMPEMLVVLVIVLVIFVLVSNPISSHVLAGAAHYIGIPLSKDSIVDKLIDMGAKIILCDPHRATVIGLNHESSLRGTTLTSPDIRAGISLLIAALSATGKSTIHNIEQIDRGYERIDERLRALGAKIERISDTF